MGHTRWTAIAALLAAGCAGDDGKANGADAGAGGGSGKPDGSSEAGGATAAGGSGEESGGASPGGSDTAGGRGPGGAGRTGSGGASSTSGGAAGTSGTSSTSGGATGSTGGTAGTAGAGGASTGVWRPFSDDSPWNTAIPADPKIDPDSQAMITDFKASSQYGPELGINISGFSIPLFYATSSTPTVDVVCDLGGEGFTGNMGMNAHAAVPWPAGAAPDPQSDHHLLVVDRARNLEWGMWNVQMQSGGWHCGLGATADLAGTGVRPYKPTNPTWYTSHGARACGFPLIAGLIRREEVDAGRIEHALVLAYPHIRAGLYTSPASTAQAKVGTDSIKTRGIPCGGHVQLDPSIDIAGLGLSKSGQAVARALQVYGAFVGDYSGSLSLYAENSADAQAHWKMGVLSSGEVGKIDVAELRVLELGMLTDDGNGG